MFRPYNACLQSGLLCFPKLYAKCTTHYAMCVRRSTSISMSEYSFCTDPGAESRRGRFEHLTELTILHKPNSISPTAPTALGAAAASQGCIQHGSVAAPAIVSAFAPPAASSPGRAAASAASAAVLPAATTAAPAAGSVVPSAVPSTALTAVTKATPLAGHACLNHLPLTPEESRAILSPQAPPTPLACVRGCSPWVMARAEMTE